MSYPFFFPSLFDKCALTFFLDDVLIERRHRDCSVNEKHRQSFFVWEVGYQAESEVETQQKGGGRQAEITADTK